MNTNIKYLSQPSSVNMADDWFDIATPEHFWVKRRFEVFRQLMRKISLNPSDLRVAEIGCGHGLVQYQFSKYYGVDIDGFELNEIALQKSIAHEQNKFLYNIHEKLDSYKNYYDLIVLFDVIEHIDDQRVFLESVLYHLKSGGLLVVNVPAFQFLYSKYDLVVGHVRRYNMNDLDKTLKEQRIQKVIGSYWGFPLLPILLMRNLLLNFSNNQKEIVDSGFKPPSDISNKLLHVFSQLELIPNQVSGTSLMCFYKKAPSSLRI